MIAKQPFFVHYIASFVLFICFSSTPLYPHGFHKNTIIYRNSGNTIQTLEHITERVKKNKRIYVTSYDQQAHQCVEKRVRAAGFSHVPYYYALSFNGEPITDILCSPTQHFYRLSDQKWVAAQDLMIGDVLLAKKNGSVRVTALAIVQQTLPVYTIHVKDTYTFLVGSHSVVVHNVILPIAATIGFGIPFSTGCGSGIGAVFGPVGFIGGILLGVGCGLLVNACFKERYIEYGIELQGNDAASFSFKRGSACSVSGGGTNFDPRDPRDRDKKEKIHTTNKQDKIDAEKLGYTLDRDPPFKSHDKLAFRKGQRWISADRDGHNGGRWKMYDRLGNRLGTFDANLVRIKT